MLAVSLDFPFSIVPSISLTLIDKIRDPMNIQLRTKKQQLKLKPNTCIGLQQKLSPLEMFTIINKINLTVKRERYDN
jgi:hypothetical protein